MDRPLFGANHNNSKPLKTLFGTFRTTVRRGRVVCVRAVLLKRKVAFIFGPPSEIAPERSYREERMKNK